MRRNTHESCSGGPGCTLPLNYQSRRSSMPALEISAFCSPNYLSMLQQSSGVPRVSPQRLQGLNGGLPGTLSLHPLLQEDLPLPQVLPAPPPARGCSKNPAVTYRCLHASAPPRRAALGMLGTGQLWLRWVGSSALPAAGGAAGFAAGHRRRRLTRSGCCRHGARRSGRSQTGHGEGRKRAT